MKMFKYGRKLLIFLLLFITVCLVIKSKISIKYKHNSKRPQQTIVHKIKISESEKQKLTSTVQNKPITKLYVKHETEFTRRRERVIGLCSTRKSYTNSTLHKVLSNLVIDLKHNLSWCPIYKSASSMWMKNFAILGGFLAPKTFEFKNHVDYTAIVRQKFQQNYSDKKKLMEINKTTKFIIVRHPFERLLSAYRDKLEHIQGREYYYGRYGKYIKHKYRAKQSNLTSLEPSFMEFLQFIAKEKFYDEHWIPFFDSCQPCFIDYDYILKFESLSSEYNFFIKKKNLKIYLNYSNQRVSTSSQGITNDSVAEKYFKNIPATLLFNIYKIYELDFLFFSYSPVKYYSMTKNANN